MSEDLSRTFANAGLDVAVEIRDRLVLLTPRGDVTSLTSLQQRRALLALAAERGYTHVALELVD
ncbi:MAG TPA: hypothetical protein VJ717_13155 [Gemmatimonadaceae bacterium]|nr:hypothetical protein [Gemmatimonadaceae bacterium]